MYEYLGRMTATVDADTVDVDLDLGLRVRRRARLQVLGIRALPGVNGAGWTRELVPAGTVLTVRTEKGEQPDRWWAQITLPDGRDYAAAAVNTGHAVWDGLGLRPAPAGRRYEYLGRVMVVVDGDTVDVDVDLGLRVHTDTRLRILGINAPEKFTPAGKLAVEWARGLLSTDTTVILRTEKDKTEKYGRWLAQLTTPDGSDYAATAIATGHAVAWDGQGIRPSSSRTPTT